MLRRAFSLTMIGACSVGLIAQSIAKQPVPQMASDKTTLNLWPHEAPGTQTGQACEVESSTSKEPLVAGKTVLRVSNVSVPTMTLYAPAGKNTGTAVVVFSGGGWRILAMDLEGTEVCQWLTVGRPRNLTISMVLRATPKLRGIFSNQITP